MSSMAVDDHSVACIRQCNQRLPDSKGLRVFHALGGELWCADAAIATCTGDLAAIASEMSSLNLLASATEIAGKLRFVAPPARYWTWTLRVVS